MESVNKTPFDKPTASDDLLSRLDAKRGMYFFNWLMGEWLSDPCGLEHVSVKTIIETYDKRSGNSMFSDNAKS